MNRPLTSASRIPNFPNLFCIYGPGTNLAAGASLFYHSEFQVHYALEAIRETLTSGARRCEVTPEAHAAYAERYQAEIDQLVWSHPSIEHSHYKNPAGKVFTLSPVALGPLLGVDPPREPKPLQLRLRG